MYKFKYLWTKYRFRVSMAAMLALKKLLDRIDINILNTELYSVGRLWNYKNVNNPYSRIYFIVEGSAYLTMDHKRHRLRPGYLYLIPCFTRVDMHCPRSFCHYYIHFTSRVETGLDILSILKSNFEAQSQKHGIGRAVFDRLLELNPQRELPEYNANKPIYKTVTERAERLDKTKTASQILECNALMRLLLSVFFIDSDSAHTSDTLSALSKFQPVIEYVRQHLDSPITLSELAAVADLNPTYFSNLFSRRMGLSPIQYVNRRRIEQAQTLLLSSHESLESIADQVGISDAFYFSRLFKSMVGVSPSAYRKYSGLHLTR